QKVKRGFEGNSDYFSGTPGNQLGAKTQIHVSYPVFREQDLIDSNSSSCYVKSCCTAFGDAAT
ncbi:hypothetical protein QYF50_24530, partial [Paenibacillus vini]|uniref:hypothetical protein n=1 Tax=Paenibacillus vini TaxID=1476024 RepID=UPI0025B6C573